MTVSTFLQPNSNTQSADLYPSILDGAVSVLSRIGDNFSPHAQSTPNLTVAVDPGHIFAGQSLIEQAAQSTSSLTAPASNPRIDRIVVSNSTGTISVVTGTEAATPTPPAIPAGCSPVAQVLLQTNTIAITNAAITDERDFSATSSSGALINVRTFTASGVYTPTAGTKGHC